MINLNYDYIIVGAGPTGLTLALLLSKYNNKVCIIERENTIGGCHGVYYENGLFAEHGPRIYVDNYLMFNKILQELGTSFEENFTPYLYGKLDVFKEIYNNLTFRELYHLSSAFLFLNSSYKNMSLMDFMQKNNFSDKAIDLLDRIGRLTDGGGAKKYTLFSFLQILNQNFLYKIYQPNKPNDVGIFKIWKKELEKRGVEIYLNSEITNVKINNNKISYIQVNNNLVYLKNLILAIPPINIADFISKFKLNDAFDKNFSQWSKLTNYNTYIPITFFWNQKLNLKQNWGYPQTEWGVGHIVLSDYMDFGDITVISTAITRLTPEINNINDKNVLASNVYFQLKTIFEDLPLPDNYVVNQNNYNFEKHVWEPKHTAFMTTKFGYMPFRSQKYINLYNCGVQNGKSDYVFTSLEASVVNAISLVNELNPKSKNDYIIKNAITLRQFIFLLIVLIIIFIFYRRQTTRT